MKDGIIELAIIEDSGEKFKVNRLTDDAHDRQIVDNILRALRLNLESGRLLDMLNRTVPTVVVLKNGKDYHVIKGDHFTQLHTVLAIFCNKKAFMRNLEPGGLLAESKRLSVEIMERLNHQNLMFIPYQFINDGDMGYWEYKIYYAGERLELNGKVNGVRVPDHFFSRHKVSLFGNLILDSDRATAMSYVELLREITKVPSYLNYFSSRGYRNLHTDVRYVLSNDKSEMKYVESTDITIVNISERRGMVDGKVRSCFIYDSSKESLLNFNILEDMVKFKEILKQPKYQIPNPPLDKEVYDIPLVKNTLISIMNEGKLIVPTKRFYVQLKHLGLIKDYRNINSIENYLHVWKLITVLEPNITKVGKILKIRCRKDDARAMTIAAGFSAVGRCLKVDEGSTVTLELVTIAKVIDRYRDLAEVNNIEII